MRTFARIVAAVAAISAAACTGFQRTETLIAPSAPTLPSAPSGGSPGALTGTWSSTAPLGPPSSWNCGEFQWSISDQTASSLAGQFYAICAGVVLIQGNASGQLNGAGTEVALHLNGTATIQSVISCPFDISGTGFIEGNKEAIRIPYSGSTCLGPVHGEEVLRRPAPNQPPPPPPSAPEPEPPPVAPAENPNHVGPGPLSVDRAHQVVDATAREFPNLTAAHGTLDESMGAAEELLLRTIWHLKLAGYDAGRQRNPSGAVSSDKLTILINGSWHAYDIFTDWDVPGRPIRVIFIEVFPPNSIAYPGIPD